MALSRDFGSFIQTTFIWDIAQINSMNIEPALKELFVRLYQNLNRMAFVLNAKDTGLYPLQEFVTGKQFFINPLLSSLTEQVPILRPVWRKTINFGALPDTAGTKSVPHHIVMNQNVTIVSIIGGATDTTGLNYIPLPYASPTLVNNIEINLDDENVNITTGSDRGNFNICYVVIEFLKQ